MSRNRVLFILGPTGVGKTEVSYKVALRYRGEIVSADSRQVYKYLDVGTDKPSLKMRRRICHHCIDIVDPSSHFSAGMYQSVAIKAIKKIFLAGHLPIVVGGSGLYTRALSNGLFKGVERNVRVRNRLSEELKSEGEEFLFERLVEVDPIYARKIHHRDHVRLIRALEIYSITGKPPSTLFESLKNPPPFIPFLIGLIRDRGELYERINRRVDRMIERGLIDEVKSLIGKGYNLNINAFKSFGYREALLYLKKRLNFQEMIEMIKKSTRNYARKQLTWFGGESRIKWIDITGSEDLDEVAVEVYEKFMQNRPEIQELS